jgi:hypothetical protein
MLAHLAHRVGQRGDLLEAGGHGLDAFLVQRQAVDQRRLQAGGARLVEVLGVGGEQFGAAGADLGGHRDQGGVLGRGGGGGEHARGGAGLTAQGLHVVLDVHWGLFFGVGRGIHGRRGANPH